MRPRRDRLALAIGGACLAHVALVGIHLGRDHAHIRIPVAEAEARDGKAIEVARLTVDADDLGAIPLVLLPGPGDAAGFDLLYEGGLIPCGSCRSVLAIAA